ncbi:hypothetical protein [Algoriphagus zhangzhouensis]|uniref:Lipoprotein n=1 Tax=Algoriphagus zhangzhouensis TaxID=1073327 RepID=A0A1M7ZAP5_9BACT|nr:hypothetical protein [Algoriphagus zhangzhouensis]TDY47058.1 hypothetical protein A8938_1510 [Algoriphagus zhangzhouensis]SHO61983.1 hypothetical protein SAMN04488108_1752 [Algoriphagus zhangzhouensis]
MKKTFTSSFLGLAISGLLLASCSQMASYENEDLALEQARADKEGFTLSPFGSVIGLNLKEYIECEDRTVDDCITDDPITWYVQSTTSSFTSNQGDITVEIFNTPTHLNYSFTSSTGDKIKKVTINDVDIYASNQPSAEPLIHSVPLGEYNVDWFACDEVTDKIEVKRVNSSGIGDGQYLLFNTSYDLLPVCEVPEEECTLSFDKKFIEIDEDGYYIYEFHFTSDTEILDDENSWEVQLTVPQISGFKALDGRTYKGEGEDDENVLRWDGQIDACVPYTFKLGFLPNCSLNDEDGKKVKKAIIVSTFNVKSKGNRLGGPISIDCPE